MNIDLNGYTFELTLSAAQHARWNTLPLEPTGGGRGYRINHKGISGELLLDRVDDRIDYTIDFMSSQRTRLRLQARLLNETELFHLIPGNIHGDNNAAHVRPGEFPC